MAGFGGGSEWRRRMLEELQQAFHRQNYERVWGDWKPPAWERWAGEFSGRSSRRGPVFDAVEERLRKRYGKRGVDLLRYLFDANEGVREVFQEADGRLLERRAEVAAEVKRRREEAARAPAPMPEADRLALAWTRAQAKLAEVSGLEWVRPWGVKENPAWAKATAKREALVPKPTPADADAYYSAVFRHAGVVGYVPNFTIYGDGL